MNTLYIDANCNDAIPAETLSKELKILIEPTDITCQIGSSINIVTTVNSSNTGYQWYNQLGEQIPNKTESNLFLKSVQMKDFGFYKLEILDLATKERILTKWVEIKRNAIRTETIKTPTTTSKPILVSSSPGGSYRIGSTLTLTACFRNVTTYQWYKDGVRLEGCIGNTLMISNANMSNSGLYALSGTNCPLSGIMEMSQGIKVSVY